MCSCHNPLGISLPVQTFQPLWSWSSNFCINDKLWAFEACNTTKNYRFCDVALWNEVIINVEHALDILFLHMCHHVGKQANRHLSKHLVSMVINHSGGQRALCSELSGPSKTIWHDAMENGWSVVYRKTIWCGYSMSMFQGMKHGMLLLVCEQFDVLVQKLHWYHLLCLPVWHYALMQVPYYLC